MRIHFLIALTFSLAGWQAHADCTAPAGVAGKLQWIAADSKVKYCDGSSWKDTSQATEASCSGTTAGTIRYSSGSFRYCNGSNWIAMKGSSLSLCDGASAGRLVWDSGLGKMKMCDGSNWYSLEAASAVAYNVILTASENNVLLTNKLVSLGWDGSSPVTATVTVNAGVIIGSTSTATAAFRSGALPAGSTLKIINKGRIQGRGGDGGAAAMWDPAQPGFAGGPALAVQLNTDLDNTTGNIWGGGGGGGGGCSDSSGYDYTNGGGGAGTTPGQALTGGGAHGTDTAGGVGGSDGYYGISGGAGGGPGLPGETGQFDNSGTAGGGQNCNDGGKPGGAAGNAIKKNGYNINWLGGNDGSRVRGPVN